MVILMKSKTLRNTALAQKTGAPKRSFLDRMKERADSLPMDRDLFTLVTELKSPATFREATAALLRKEKDAVIPFLYLCAIDSDDPDFRTNIMHVLSRVGSREAREALITIHEWEKQNK